MLLVWVLVFPFLLVLFLPCFFAYKASLWVYRLIEKLLEGRPSDGFYVVIDRGLQFSAVFVTILVAFAFGLALDFVCVPVFLAVFLFFMVPYYIIVAC